MDTGPEPDTARERLRAWLAVNPSTPLTAREAAELLGVSRSRAGVLFQQERAGAQRPARRAAMTGLPCPSPPPRRRLAIVRPPGLGLVDRRARARTGLACGAAPGNPAPGRGPAGCLLDGLPPRRLRASRVAARSLRASLGLRPPLDPPAPRRPGETRSPGAGEEQRPTSRQEARTVADHARDPHPRRHLLTHHQEGGPGTRPDHHRDPAASSIPSPEEGTAMPDTHVTITGNLTDDPEVTFTPNGAAVRNFRVAVTARIKDGDSWRDGDTSFYRITAWRQLAEHIGDSLAKGNRVIVVGQLRARSWETPEGERRTVVEVQAEEVGPSLRWATAKPERATNGKPAGQFNDDPPF